MGARYPHTYRLGYARGDYPKGDMVDCKLAMRGKKVPTNFEHDVVKYCIIRGIRYHPGFALELQDRLPEFRRALNARSIMSNEIPEMTNSDEFPYCFWHPDVASEETYCRLAARYPQLKYNVGRACAVAGYATLFRELGLLPEVHIAEEARDNGHDGIFKMIMSQPILWEVMNDNDLAVNLDCPRAGAVLNGDTAVCSFLNHRNKLKFHRCPPNRRLFNYPAHPTHLYNGEEPMNITEDWRVDICGTKSRQTSTLPWRTDVDLAPLICEPLPKHLPNINKDLLILMAAYYGNIERYSRLRRPYFLELEEPCLIHGILYNPAFARWCANHFKDLFKGRWDLSQAITARYIMSNNLSRISDLSHLSTELPGSCPSSYQNPPRVPWWAIPEVIWFPQLALESTYQRLAELAPEMREVVARAMIVGDYQKGFVKLDPEPTEGLILEANTSSNPFYKSYLAAKPPLEEEDENLSPFERKHRPLQGWATIPYPSLLEHTHMKDTWLGNQTEDERLFLTAQHVFAEDSEPSFINTNVDVRRVEENLLQAIKSIHDEDLATVVETDPESDWEFEVEAETIRRREEAARPPNSFRRPPRPVIHKDENENEDKDFEIDWSD